MRRKNNRRRPPVSIGDILVLVTMQAYRNQASRKAIPDPSAVGKYLQRRPPKPRTLLKYMQDARLTDALRKAIVRTSDIVRHFETGFAIDSTYLKSSNLEIVVAANGARIQVINTLVQLAVGVETLVAFAVDLNVHDQNAFIPLLQQFWDRVRLDNVYADAGYCDGEHYEAVAARGGTAWIDFVETNGHREPQGLPHHDEMLKMYREDKDAWLARYHKRNVIESANKVIKTTLKRRLRSRKPVALENEVLALILAYNLCRLLVARREHALAIRFADERAVRVMDGLEPLPEGEEADAQEAA